MTTIEPLAARANPATLRFLADWVTGDLDHAIEHLADHESGDGSSLVALEQHQVVGIATLRWQSNCPGFRNRNIPLLQQIAVAGPFRRLGIASALMDAAEVLARERGHRELGISVGLFDQYGPAQRMYAQRGYVPDGRGACRGQVPIVAGETVTVDHELIIWLTKPLPSR